MADTHVERLILVIRPSSGGFSVEFFKFCFVDIGQMLVCSINEGFVNDHLSATQRQGVITCIPKEETN